MNNHALTMIQHMARRSGTLLTDQHLKVLDFAHEYYAMNRVGPLYPNIQRATGSSKEDIRALFPYGLNSVFTWVGIPVHTPEHPCKPMASVEVEDYREVYLDHNATTYLRPEVRDFLVDLYANGTGYGNPSSSTGPGARSHEIVRKARAQVAKCLAVEPHEIIFVGCGTEANNLAIKGVAFGHLGRPAHVVTSKIEHPSVLETMQFLEELGFDVTYIDCDEGGRLRPADVEAAIQDNTILVSLMAVNNEIGTINPIGEIGRICEAAGVPLMSDCVQAFGKIPLRPKRDGISMASFSGHKIYAPKGIAALYIDDSISLTPLLHGGGQEGGIRSGTENVDLIAAFGQAAELIHREREPENKRLRELQQYFLTKLREVEPECTVNGSTDDRIPHNLSIGFPGVDSGSLLLSLNEIGIYISSGSACHAGSEEASHVLSAMGADTENFGSIRFSFGLQTAREDLDYLFRYLGEILERLRGESEVYS